MKLKRIALDNFRCFKHFETTFEDNLTVFVAANGQGKTAILEAITYLLGVFLGRLPQTAVPKLKKTDMLMNVIPFEHPRLLAGVEWRKDALAPFVRVTGVDDNKREWDTTLRRDASAKTKKSIPPAKGGKEILAVAERIMDMVNSDSSPKELFPVFSYYDTSRAVIRKKADRMSKFRKAFNRYEGYKDALDGHLNYKKMIEWFFLLEYKRSETILLTHEWQFQTIEHKTIQLAIEKTLPGFSNLRIHIKPFDLIVDIEKEGGFNSCRVGSQLSDGHKTVLVMVLDIVSRILELNSDIAGVTPERLLETPGIVLIDEIDLHLHPSWQQRIIGDLQRTFPNIQFIVTTHSPQVVSSVPSECVRIIDEGKIHFAKGSEGADSSRILPRIFGTSSFPENNIQRKKLQEYLDLVYKQRKWSEPDVLKKRQELDAIYQGEEPLLDEADLFIENEEWEKQNGEHS